MATGILVAETHVEVLVYGWLVRQDEAEELRPAVVIPVLARLHRDDIGLKICEELSIL